MPVHRNEVYISLFGWTIRDVCIEAWRQGFAYFQHAGLVYFCLGNGRSDDDWYDAGLTARDLVN